MATGAHLPLPKALGLWSNQGLLEGRSHKKYSYSTYTEPDILLSVAIF